MVYPFLPVFGRGLGVDLQLLSLAITIRSTSGIFGPFLASVGDSRGRKFGMLLGVLLFTLSALLMVFWPSYWVFVLSLVLGYMGNFVFMPSMQAFVGDRVPYEQRGRVLGLIEVGWSLAFIIGVPVMGFLIGRSGWLAPFPWLVGMGAAAILALMILLPNDPPVSAERPGVLKNLGAVARYGPAQAGILMAMAMSSSNEMINLTFGTWLEQSFQVKIAALAAASFIIGASELSGEVLVTGVVDRLGKRRAVLMGLVGNMLAALALPLLGRSLTGALVGLFFIYFTFEFMIVSSIPLMTEVIPRYRATLMSIFIAGLSIGRALGALIVPFLYRSDTALGAPPSILPVMLSVVFLNLLAAAALRHVRVASSAGPELLPG